jgi:hypothetical protein
MLPSTASPFYVTRTAPGTMSAGVHPTISTSATTTSSTITNRPSSSATSSAGVPGAAFLGTQKTPFFTSESWTEHLAAMNVHTASLGSTSQTPSYPSSKMMSMPTASSPAPSMSQRENQLLMSLVAALDTATPPKGYSGDEGEGAGGRGRSIQPHTYFHAPLMPPSSTVLASASASAAFPAANAFHPSFASSIPSIPPPTAASILPGNTAPMFAQAAAAAVPSGASSSSSFPTFPPSPFSFRPPVSSSLLSAPSRQPRSRGRPKGTYERVSVNLIGSRYVHDRRIVGIVSSM